MGKIGTDSYLARFDKYGNGKTKPKKNKGKKEGKTGKGKDKKYKSLEKRVSELEELCARTAQAANAAVSSVQDPIDSLRLQLCEIEKSQQTVAARLKVVEKTQKSLEKKVESAAVTAAAET